MSTQLPHRRLASRELRWLHWIVALLVIVAVTGILARQWLPSGHSLRPTLRLVHLTAGQLVLVAAVMRLVARLRSPLNGDPAMPWFQAWTARLVHFGLYSVIFLQPVTGIVFWQAGDKKVSLFGLEWPQLVESNVDLHFAMKYAHQNIAIGLYVLLSIHVAAALWHHFVLRDNTLRHMLGRLPTQPKALDQPMPGEQVPTVDAALRQRLVEGLRSGQSPAQLAEVHGISAETVAGCAAIEAAQMGSQALAARPLPDAQQAQKV